jgi:hypothetical protein
LPAEVNMAEQNLPRIKSLFFKLQAAVISARESHLQETVGVRQLIEQLVAEGVWREYAEVIAIFQIDYLTAYRSWSNSVKLPPQELQPDKVVTSPEK